MASRASLVLALAAGLSLIFALPGHTEKAEKLPALRAEAMVISKSAEPVSAVTRDFLSQSAADQVKVWVNFTDKGVFDKTAFDALAAQISLSEKVIQRRAKTGMDHIVFADLPVVQNYVDRIVSLGAKHRRSSKWLNAASFEIPLELLDDVGSLPFVASVKPVAGFKRSNEVVEEALLEPPLKDFNTPDALNYGFAQEQLTQINVPAMHNQGLNGDGVTLAIFDTGYRKSHDAFAQHYVEGRVLGEYDFVFNDYNTANEGEDWSSQWNHGTYIWSTSGGYDDGTLYGPAYRANFLLAKTEDVRSETPVEEDNWQAAVEWADTMGADVITSSLGYSDWYTYADFDGQTATVTIAANMATSFGILVCNSAGNGGPGSGTISAPADAFEILSCGAVSSSGTLASFSSRGPTFDGRTKPEVCAQGVSTACASTSGDDTYTTASGTSLSTPLLAGVACLLIQAHPDFPPQLIREALMMTADNADAPDNNYGWGILNGLDALGYGADFAADTTYGEVPLTVNFTDLSPLTTTGWTWHFGDGDSSLVQNPTHTYNDPGAFPVSLTINTQYGPISNERQAFVVVVADTLTFVSDSGAAGGQAVMSVNLTNTQEMSSITIPFRLSDAPLIKFDSVARGARTEYFELLEALAYDPWNAKYTYRLAAENGGGSPLLPIGSGEVMKIYFTIGGGVAPGTVFEIDTASSPYSMSMTSEFVTYSPVINPGMITVGGLIVGDLNLDGEIDVGDLVTMVNHAYGGAPLPGPEETFDVNGDGANDIEDIVYMVDYMFNDGPPPLQP